MARISAEKGTMIFAIINLAIVTISIVSGIGYLVYLKCHDDPTPRASTSRFGGFQHFTLFSANKVYFLLTLAYLILVAPISLLFSSFLMNGIRKKNPAHIKVYYIFGIVMIILSFIIVVAACVNEPKPDAICLVLLTDMIYSSILYMIRRTYLQYETNADQFGHLRLVEKC